MSDNQLPEDQENEQPIVSTAFSQPAIVLDIADIKRALAIMQAMHDQREILRWQYLYFRVGYGMYKPDTTYPSIYA